MMRANLGCGGQIATGWVNIDRDFDRSKSTPSDADVRMLDMRAGLPFTDDELDYAVAHHVVDLLTPHEIDNFLIDCRRVIKPGGTLRISLADTMQAIDQANLGNGSYFDDMGLRAEGTLERLHEYLWLHGSRRSFLTVTTLALLLAKAEFKPYVVSFQHTLAIDQEITSLDTRPRESIWLEGQV